MSNSSSLISGALLALCAATTPAQQSYPNKAMRIIVPYPPGGTSDILARSLAEKLTGSWGQPVVVENKPGANGNVGAAQPAGDRR